MLTAARRFVQALLWDEAAAQRYLAVVCYLLGDVVSGGGLIPGTELVVPGLTWLFPIAPYLKALGFYLGAGASLPTRRVAPTQTTP